MKVIIGFDSVYGNTRKVAEMITVELIARGHEAVLVSVREKNNVEITGDLLFIGSPTRMARMTGKTKSFAKKLDDGWKGKHIFAFDTIMAMPEDPKKMEKAKRWTENGAAPKLANLLRKKGFTVDDEMLRVTVAGLKGPLADNANDVVKQFLNKVL